MATRTTGKRRSRGEGSVFQRSDGRWAAKIYLGEAATETTSPNSLGMGRTPRPAAGLDGTTELLDRYPHEPHCQEEKCDAASGRS